MANEFHVLSEFDSLSQVYAPLKSTNRIKYTCFNVSKNFLIFGATSGGLYVFKREPCVFLQLLPSKEGSVTQVSVSPDEKFFAFATLKGLVCVLERTQFLKIRRLQVSAEHQGAEVTALCWDNTSNELFIGDDSGKVSVVNVSPFMAKNMFQQSTFPLMQLDSKIVQLDWCSELLLVSTLSRCYICDTVREQYRQIGQKLRDGEYGACFYTGKQTDVPEQHVVRETARSGEFSSWREGEKLSGHEGKQNLKIFCARPGCRLWEVHVDGTVVSTHQFKQALAIPPVAIIRLYGQGINAPSNCQQSFNFTKLFVIAKKFLFSFNHDGICILDPVKGDVALWSNCLRDIVDVKVLNDVIYVWTAAGSFHSVGMLALDKLLTKLYFRKHYVVCAQLCLQHIDYLLELVSSSSRLQLLTDLGTKLADNEELSNKISPLLQEIVRYSREKQNSQRLKSGIFLVGNSELFWNDVNRQEGKSRSLSASPENIRKRRSWTGEPQRRTASTLSLPELEHFAVANRNLESFAACNNAHQSESNSKSVEPFCFDSTFPPEAIQALRELKQNFPWKIINTKVLKEKWQILEDKMKLLNPETNMEPLDIRPQCYQDTTEEQKLLATDVELVHSSTATIKQPPAVDVTACAEFCKHFVGNNKSLDVSNMSEFLDIVSDMHNSLLSSLVKDEAQNSCSYLNNLRIGPFPFKQYFPDEKVRTIQDVFHMAVNSTHLFAWVQSKAELFERVLVDEFPEQLQEYCSQNMLKFDFVLSRILVIFSDIMDHKVVLHCLKRAELPCYYLSLCEILDRYQEGSVHSEAIDQEEIPLPILLNTIFYMMSMEGIETCCRLSRQVCVKDIWYLVLRLQQRIESAGKDKLSARAHCHALFLSILEKMSANKDCLSELLPDDQLKSFVTCIFEELNYMENGSCLCGFPVVNPPLLPYPELAELIVVYYWENSQVRLIEMCKSVPSLWHLVLPRKRSGDFTSVLPLMIHLGSISELTNWMPCMSYQDWENTLQFLVRFQGGTCLNCGFKFTVQVKGISWSSLGSLLVKALGSQEAIQLLSKYSSDIDPGDLDKRFFQACILSAIVDSHTDGIRSEVINLFTEYAMKASDTSMFSPEVASSVEAALKEDLGKQVEFTLASERHHWGVKINLEDGNCPCCLLPLGSPVLMKDGGVTTYRCSHSFHALCLRRRLHLYSCPVCTKTS